MVANECQHPDLYWAIRGGGGNTYGVIADMTMKAYPMPGIHVAGFQVGGLSTTTSEEWWAFAARFHAQLAEVSDRGVHGYWAMETAPFTLGGTMFAYNMDGASAEEAMIPLSQFFREQGAVVNATWQPVPVASYPDFVALSKQLNPGRVSGRSQSASRLLSRSTVRDDTAVLADVLRTIGTSSVVRNILTLTWLLHLARCKCFEIKSHVANLPTSQDALPQSSISLSGSTTLSNQTVVDNALPARWRDSVVHLLVNQNYDDSTPDHVVQQVKDDMAFHKLGALRSLDADAPAYLNEVCTIRFKKK